MAMVVMVKAQLVKEDIIAIVAEDEVVDAKKGGESQSDNEDKQDDGVLLMAYSGVDIESSFTWYLDTGASNHMCGRKEFFAELNEEFSGTITFGDLSQRSVKGKGKILLQLKTGGRSYISDVYYVPEMKNNILSLGQLLERVYDIQMRGDTLSMFDKNYVLVAAIKMAKNCMFPLHLNMS
ncbi:uncharacterized protein LOC127802223 [Diospyros lotus]|uniref:uncharacterized protein LOC127802223 n=1 Tax=Diospyros lotus TaxID=55363 RepID=UPI00224D9130|nr:uncharacterized protein LOC127802223 [Diospyros lotus]